MARWITLEAAQSASITSAAYAQACNAWFQCSLNADAVRCRDAIVRWVTKMTGPPTNIITTVEELKAAEAASNAIVVGYFAADTPENDTALSAFISIARADMDDIFYQTSVAEVGQAASASLNSFSVVSTFQVRPPLPPTTLCDHLAACCYICLCPAASQGT